MTTAARHLRPVPSAGEVPADGPQTFAEALDIIDMQTRKLQGAWAQITKLERQLSDAQAVEPEAEQIMDVLQFWRERCSPNAKIVVGSERWLKVRARLREKDVVTKEPCYRVLDLKAAVIGALLSDFHVQGKSKGYLDAASVFADSKKVDAHIARAVGFKRTYGTSALTIVDELAGEGLRWLAERCACEHTWLEHLRHGGPTPDGRQPCSRCDCGDFDWFHANLERRMFELEQRAREGDPKAVATMADVRWFEGRG